jgi:hypothetical protein
MLKRLAEGALISVFMVFAFMVLSAIFLSVVVAVGILWLLERIGERFVGLRRRVLRCTGGGG